MERLTTHIQKGLVKHIKDELKFGYTLDAIKDVLLNYHHQNIVDAAIEQLHKEGFKVEYRKFKGKKLDRDLFFRTVSLLKVYIAKQRQRGYKMHDVREALVNYGHAREAVEAAIDSVESGRTPQYYIPPNFEAYRTAMLPVGIVVYFIFSFVMAILVQEMPLKMLAIFSPFALTVFALTPLWSAAKNKYVLLIVPVLASAGGYFVFTMTGYGIFENIDVEKITGLNFLFGFIYATVYMGLVPEVEEYEVLEFIEHREDKDIDEERMKDNLAVKFNKSKDEIEAEIEEQIRLGKHGLKAVPAK